MLFNFIIDFLHLNKKNQDVTSPIYGSHLWFRKGLHHGKKFMNNKEERIKTVNFIYFFTYSIYNLFFKVETINLISKINLPKFKYDVRNHSFTSYAKTMYNTL